VRGQYRFQKTQGGATRFARVELSVETGTGPFKVSFEQLELGGSIPPEIQAACTAGAMVAAQSIEGLYPESPPAQHVRVHFLEWSSADTFLDAVRCSSAIAVWRALLPDKPAPEPIFEGRWQVKFPTTAD
jgi:hypothetical protein